VRRTQVLQRTGESEGDYWAAAREVNHGRSGGLAVVAWRGLFSDDGGGMREKPAGVEAQPARASAAARSATIARRWKRLDMAQGQTEGGSEAVFFRPTKRRQLSAKPV
jgi:hypothetical protein